MNFLWPNFLTDSKEYARADALWKDNWQDLVYRLGESERWKAPWAQDHFADGTECRDGNPIFTAVNPELGIGIQVIQLEPANDPKEFTFWLDTFAKGEPEEIKELVIALVLSEETLLRSLDLMAQWITRQEIEEIWPSQSGGCSQPGLR